MHYNKLFSNGGKKLISQLTLNWISRSSSFTTISGTSFHLKRTVYGHLGKFKILDISKKCSLQFQTIPFTESVIETEPPKRKKFNIVERMLQGKMQYYEKYVNCCFEEDFNGVQDSWQKVFDQINEDGKVSKPAFGTYLMKKCLQENNLTIPASYIDFLKINNQTLNFVAMAVYLQIIAKNYFKLEQEELFRNIYKELLKNEPMHQETRLLVINALIQIKNWDEVDRHLTILETTSDDLQYLTKACNLLIQALAQEKGFDSAYKYLDLLGTKCNPGNLQSSELYLDEETIIALLQSVQRSDSNEFQSRQFALIFKALQIYEVKVSEDFAKSLFTLLPSYWKLHKVMITNGKSCSCCGTKLLPPSLDSATFNKLREEVLEKVVKGKDIFHSTTPEEWKNFVQYLDRQGPFDLVVDGLNLYYVRPDGVKRLQAEQNYLHVSQDHYGAKILVLTRQHQKNWTMKRRSLFPNMHYYFVDSITKDDVFVLYAAFHSGIGCKVMTRDYLRNHKFILGDPVLMRQFLIWQIKNQILVQVSTRRDGLIYKIPYQYQPITQWDGGKQSWHVPLKSEEKPDYLEGCQKWLCVAKKRKGAKTL